MALKQSSVRHGEGRRLILRDNSNQVVIAMEFRLARSRALTRVIWRHSTERLRDGDSYSSRGCPITGGACYQEMLPLAADDYPVDGNWDEQTRFLRQLVRNLYNM